MPSFINAIKVTQIVFEFRVFKKLKTWPSENLYLTIKVHKLINSLYCPKVLENEQKDMI
jgi:hypothetical protein